ncbi:hypothetical protein ERO13_D11G243550v2 [Gossypium hirsutum]|uniref:Uncharacterized protein n=1 Tax=Gossypium barbadense TaxID=3634 RepID=A0A5J5PF89_GOSBA|nr:hypothetical protein ES319_D11G262300v1 [Gossypium barbadense]KAG4122047.1 hypothetical protein ERO13_D11G243550v2 [Gossypium hirsutum]
MEACKGFLRSDGEWPSSAKAEGSLIAKPTREWKGRHSKNKSYSRDNRLIFPKSSHQREVCSKGWAIRSLKWYMSWVQNFMR